MEISSIMEVYAVIGMPVLVGVLGGACFYQINKRLDRLERKVDGLNGTKNKEVEKE